MWKIVSLFQLRFRTNSTLLCARLVACSKSKNTAALFVEWFDRTARSITRSVRVSETILSRKDNIRQRVHRLQSHHPPPHRDAPSSPGNARTLGDRGSFWKPCLKRWKVQNKRDGRTCPAGGELFIESMDRRRRPPSRKRVKRVWSLDWKAVR